MRFFTSSAGSIGVNMLLALACCQHAGSMTLRPFEGREQSFFENGLWMSAKAFFGMMQACVRVNAQQNQFR